MHLNDIPASFNQGAADLLGAAMCIGMAQGIIIILGGTDASSGTVLNKMCIRDRFRPLDLRKFRTKTK